MRRARNSVLARAWHRPWTSARIGSWIPSHPAERRILLASFVDTAGTGMFLPLAVAFLTRDVGLSATHIGLGLGIAGAVAVPATPGAGMLIDRFGARLVIIGCCTVNAAGFIAYLGVTSFAAFSAAATAVQVATRIDRPATASLVLGSVPEASRVQALARQQALRNVGYGVGGVAAGVVLALGSRAAFDAAIALNAISYAAAGIVIAGVRPLDCVGSPGRSRGDGYRPVLADRRFVRAASLNTLVALHDSLLRIGVPLWILARAHAPVALSGLLFALNTVLVATLQVRTTRRIEQSGGIGRSYRRAAFAFLVCGGLFALSAGAPIALALMSMTGALVAITAAEMENAAEEVYVSVVIAPAESRPRYISLFKTSMSLQQAIGPVVVAFALSKLGDVGCLLISTLAALSALATRAVVAGPRRDASTPNRWPRSQP